MIDNLKILAVCPARGGSKGIPLKNLVPFLGVPLVARVGHLVSEISMIDRAIVSTDHPEIAEVARQSGLEVPFLRPETISGDQISDTQVLVHAIQEMENIDKVQYDLVVMLQPTSPLRRKEHIVQAIEMMREGPWDAVWTVSETDSKHHPLKQLKIEADQLSYNDPAGHQIIARQQLTPLYHRNGVAYVISRDCLLSQNNITGKRTGALILPDYYISIDTMWDFKLSEFIYHSFPEIHK